MFARRPIDSPLHLQHQPKYIKHRLQQKCLQAGVPDDLPEGMHITDDDYVLAHVQSRAGKWDEHLHSEIKPDLIIENLSDLLDIFIEVGEQ